MLQRAAFRCVAQFFRLALLAGAPRRCPPQASGCDPAWGNMPLLMQKQVKRAVRCRLEDEGEGKGKGKGLSTIIDELLTEWFSKRS
jgi:hypothetical protein